MDASGPDELFAGRRWARRPLRAIARRLTDLLLPPHCPACGARVLDAAALCAGCWSGLHLIDRPFCPRTATPFTLDPGPGAVAPEALQHPPDFDRARAAVLYEGCAPVLIHRLKYGDRHEIVGLIARLMRRAGADVLAEAELVIPVPLHPRRLWQRRFNQAALLARAACGSHGPPVRSDLLVRRKPTPPQVGLSRAARARNLAGAFVVPAAGRADVAGRRVVLVDDVYTSGATLSAAARALKAAGAASVDALVFARVTQTIATA